MFLKGLPFEAYVNYVEGKMGSIYEWNSEKASFNSLWLNYFFSVNSSLSGDQFRDSAAHGDGVKF